MEALKVLKEPFPTHELALLDFGSADGRKDTSLEESFVLTNSVKQFLQDRHSIIVGPMGSGKSALFELLKNKSNKLPVYKDRMLIPIEEAISFQLLRNYIEDQFENYDQKLIYKLIWKFQILNRTCEELAKLPNFPESAHEKEINKFLGQIKSKEFDESLLGKVKGLLKAVIIKTKVSAASISLEAEINSSNSSKKELNLDRIYKCVESVISIRAIKQPMVIIDRIDTFVAGEDYDTQKAFISALLEVDDDIDISYPSIGRKIFLRSDLFARLDYEALGYDKVNDNTLRITWSDFELIYFLANRILTAFKKRKILSEADVLLSTNLDDYHLGGVNSLRTIPFIPLVIKKYLFNLSSINRERDSSLLEKVNKALVTKVFPHIVTHKDSSSEDKDIDIFEFILTHFKDGHGKVMPRNILAFLKQVIDTAARYYDENPDQEVLVVNQNGDWEWELFKKKCVYEAYCQSKISFIRNISKVSNEWTNYFSSFIGKRGNKKTIDFNWMKSIIALDDTKVIQFLAYLDHIGFLYISEPHPDPKRRKYRIPIIYMPTP